MKPTNKILLIGPVPPPLTGESFCNKILLQKIPDDSKFQLNYINTAPKEFDEKLGKITAKKIWHNLKNYTKIYKIISHKIIYATIGQTFAGVLKFAPYFLFAKIIRKPIIIHIHGNNLLNQYQQQNIWKKKVFHFIISLANKGIVLSKNLKSNLKPFLSEKNIFILSNFVDKNIITNKNEILKTKNLSKLKILYLSNLMTQKGIFELLEALTELDKKGINYSATLAGNIDKNIKNKFYKKLKSLNKVQYVGMVVGKTKKELFLQSNVFILPSYREGQPLSIFEAMATGNIVISTKHPGITDIFTPQQIKYIEKKSISSITNALLEIEKKLPNYQSTILSNHQYIINNFTEEKFIENFKKIIQN